MVEIAIVRIVGEIQGSYEDIQYVMDMVKSKITDWDQVDEKTYSKLVSSMSVLKLYEQGYRIIIRERDPDFILTTVKAFERWSEEQEKMRAAEKAAREAKKRAREQAKLVKSAQSEKALLEELAKKHGLKVQKA